jgi:nucleotide-binding universal stress UspA family protein
MATVTIVCTDGSDLAIRAASAGLAVLRPTDTVMIVTVVDGIDPSLTYDGSGHAGASMTPEAFEALRDGALRDSEAIIERTAASLRIDNVETRLLEGRPGEVLCALAAEVFASALIMGTRGRGGIKRALLGSVSDYVVRNAPCPVVVIGEKGPIRQG